MNLRFHHLVLLAAAFISEMAVAKCPKSKIIPRMGVYYLCANRLWHYDCGTAYIYNFSPYHGTQFGLLWSKKRCDLIGAESAASLSIAKFTRILKATESVFLGGMRSSKIGHLIRLQALALKIRVHYD